jgi:hypothetical protein
LQFQLSSVQLKLADVALVFAEDATGLGCRCKLS